VYRDQLSEIKADSARGLIAASEAEAARVEIARRLIGVSGKEPPADGQAGSGKRRKFAAVVALAGIPILAFAFYLSLGSPELPSVTASDRAASGPSDIAVLLSRVENHLAEHPDDGRGWELLAPIYLRLGRTADSVKARKNALRLLGDTAEREADYGAALVMDANGVVTAEARAAFQRAVALGGEPPKVKFFLGLAAEQDGRRDEAEKIWQALALNAPADAPWLQPVLAGLERLKNSKKMEDK
jgi:cytochrome c-type biogenesis protein CcmH